MSVLLTLVLALLQLTYDVPLTLLSVHLIHRVLEFTVEDSFNATSMISTLMVCFRKIPTVMDYIIVHVVCIYIDQLCNVS